ncbi:MAG: PRTRC system protein B [Flavobacterium sp. 38-13]|uniref:PRTRC system protein B n=1 Tax=Flavobacterium sp. 38-13 TaxID=1896168 RepID=UPI000962459E|nr:PRTRC system protein B [Flavobacterium sp. 38-13]OJX54884.1 MAG: PRTRC system protein B [Flavobacterium sp. 38-13]
MENIQDLYHPTSALVFYSSTGSSTGGYVEHYDMDRNGNPINAHPLTVREAELLAKSLTLTKQDKEPSLRTETILNPNILFLDAVNVKVIWYTKKMRRDMLFTEQLGLKNGTANVPPMLWVATRQSLSVYALPNNRRPTTKTKLCYAPFFNVYESGNVCLGNVDVQIARTASLEEFTKAWEGYFFNSYFSHLMSSYNPVKGNCVSLWKSLLQKEKNFPMEVLKESNVKLNSLLK